MMKNDNKKQQSKTCELAFQFHSPVCMSSGIATGNIKRTLDYIPGSAIRGALAKLYLHKYKESDGDFRRLFLEDAIFYGNLTLNKSLPIPLSFRTCKYSSGFTKDHGHGVIDHLFFSLDKTDDYFKKMHCQHAECKAPQQQMDGFFDPESFKSVNTDRIRRIITRSSIDDHLHTAEQSKLYSTEVLDTSERGDRFIGSIICKNPDYADLLNNLLIKVLDEERISIHFGTGRSRGFGKAILFSHTEQKEKSLEEFKKQVSEFNNTFQEKFSDGNRFYFCLSLLSDLIIEDEFFCNQTILNHRNLSWEGGFDDLECDVKLEHSFSSARAIQGWNNILKVPKTTDISIIMGSVFLYSVAEKYKDTLLPFLYHIDKYGVGERRSEGFGRIAVSGVFHTKAKGDFNG